MEGLLKQKEGKESEEKGFFGMFQPSDERKLRNLKSQAVGYKAQVSAVLERFDTDTGGNSSNDNPTASWKRKVKAVKEEVRTLNDKLAT